MDCSPKSANCDFTISESQPNGWITYKEGIELLKIEQSEFLKIGDCPTGNPIEGKYNHLQYYWLENVRNFWESRDNSVTHQLFRENGNFLA